MATVTQLSQEMSLLLEYMKVELHKQTTEITESITATILHTVDEKLKPVIAENEKLRSEVETLNKKIQFLEVNARKNNLVLHGIPEAEDENIDNLHSVAIRIIKELDVELENSDINKVQRIGKKIDNEKIRPILLSTTTLQKKVQILRNKKKMKEKTYITQDYSKEEMEKRKAKADNFRENEKRKRNSETPSPRDQPSTSTKKIPKVDAFQLMRERAYSMSEKNTYLDN